MGEGRGRGSNQSAANGKSGLIIRKRKEKPIKC